MKTMTTEEENEHFRKVIAAQAKALRLYEKREALGCVSTECSSCEGTGVYSGMGEPPEVGVVCSSCRGTGEYIYHYKPFKERKPNHKVKRVLRIDPGIKAGDREDFGGMSYADWLKGKPFPPKSEMRLYVCPAWWYQIANYDLKPGWDACIGIGSFSDCDSFKCRAACWTRFDDENGEKK